MGMIYDVRLEGREVQLEVEATDGGWRVREVGGDWRVVAGRFAQPGELLLVLDGRQRAVGVHSAGDRVSVQADGHAFSAEVVDPRKVRADLAGGAGEGVVATPMPGVVVRIPAKVGQAVKAGDVIVVVEAMKMENEFKAPVDGVVASIDVAVGQALEASAILAHIDAAD
ncbi:MAG: DUF2118 domain-containing protein [Alphaproteobacteria bacterium]|nr:DUF2118 domain-containing protein [Alphaproteobacteria bacterium]MCB9690373.1 DUF2118 domain-containing protein [Alphaproteobacteria bacterium]